MMHGLFNTAHCFVAHYAGDAPAFVLARLGYDVWLGNTRGSDYSQGHISLDPERDYKEFYDFSFEEIGKHDIPAMIDGVLNETQNQKLTYVGHSQGTSTMLYALHLDETSLMDKVNLCVFLAPAARVA